jgi:hypothetical protein
MNVTEPAEVADAWLDKASISKTRVFEIDDTSTFRMNR